jgi:hypothetical protein
MQNDTPLADWDTLPDTALVSRETVARLLQCHAKTVARLELQGKLRRHHALGQARYAVGDVRKMLAEA